MTRKPEQIHGYDVGSWVGRFEGVGNISIGQIIGADAKRHWILKVMTSDGPRDWHPLTIAGTFKNLTAAINASSEAIGTLRFEIALTKAINADERLDALEKAHQISAMKAVSNELISDIMKRHTK